MSINIISFGNTNLNKLFFENKSDLHLLMNDLD